ncbi:MAG: hypothetical protein ACKORA_06840 [Solirubrobacterales bacterium]
MGPVFAEAEIDATREEIFEYLLDVASRPVIFGPDMEQFHLFDLDPVGKGAGYRFRFKRGGWVGMTLVSTERRFDSPSAARRVGVTRLPPVSSGSCRKPPPVSARSGSPTGPR